VTKQKITGTLVGKEAKAALDEGQIRVEKLWESIEEEAQKDIEAMKAVVAKGSLDQSRLKTLGGADEDLDEVARQARDLKDLQNDDEDMETVQDDDSDIDEMKRIIKETKTYEDEEEKEDEEMEDEEAQDDDDEEEAENDDEEMEDEEQSEEFGESSDEGEDSKPTAKGQSGKQSLKQRIKEEQEIRKKEKDMRTGTDQPTSIDDFERLVVSNTD